MERLRGFADHPLVGETCGVGLVGAVELVANKETKAPFDPIGMVGGECFARCEEHGLIIRNLGDRIAFCPPLIISEAEIDMMFDRFGKALDETNEWVNAKGMAAE